MVDKVKAHLMEQFFFLPTGGRQTINIDQIHLCWVVQSNTTSGGTCCEVLRADPQGEERLGRGQLLTQLAADAPGLEAFKWRKG